MLQCQVIFTLFIIFIVTLCVFKIIIAIQSHDHGRDKISYKNKDLTTNYHILNTLSAVNFPSIIKHDKMQLLFY